jgi:hypothetical protein
MTRRKFIRKLISAGSALIAGTSWLAQKTTPRRFVWASRSKKYPGTVKTLDAVSKNGKWSG